MNDGRADEFLDRHDSIRRLSRRPIHPGRVGMAPSSRTASTTSMYDLILYCAPDAARESHALCIYDDAP